MSGIGLPRPIVPLPRFFRRIDMKQNDPPNENWEPCSYGLIQHTAAKTGIVRRRLFALSGAVVSILLIVAILSFSYFGTNPRIGIPTAIDCTEVNLRLEMYAAKKIEDKELNRRISYHLIKCGPCGDEFSEILCRLDPGCNHKPGNGSTIKPCPESRTP